MTEKKYNQEELDFWKESAIAERFSSLYETMFKDAVDFHITERLIMFHKSMLSISQPDSSNAEVLDRFEKEFKLK